MKQGWAIAQFKFGLSSVQRSHPKTHRDRDRPPVHSSRGKGGIKKGSDGGKEGDGGETHEDLSL